MASSKAPTSGEVTVHIDAPPLTVYELVSDVTRMGEWSPETYRCEWIDADGARVGARFRAWNRRGRMRWSNRPEVIAAEPGREFAFRRKAAGSVVVWRYRIAGRDDGADVTESYELEKASLGVLNWVATAMMGVDDRDADLRAGMSQTLERVAAVAQQKP